jgi:hypothetical protein
MKLHITYAPLRERERERERERDLVTGRNASIQGK